jgi:preprotein translocase subunit YajC
MDQQTMLIIGILIVFFVFTIVPQFTQRRRRERELSAIQVGDWIVTIGGIIGRIVALDANEVRLRVSATSELTLVRPAIRGKIPAHADFGPSDDEQDAEGDDEEEDASEPEQAS